MLINPPKRLKKDKWIEKEKQDEERYKGFVLVVWSFSSVSTHIMM